MRLIVAKLYYNLPTILLVVFIGGIIFYFSIKQNLENHALEILEIRKEYAIKLNRQIKGLPNTQKHTKCMCK